MELMQIIIMVIEELIMSSFTTGYSPYTEFIELVVIVFEELIMSSFTAGYFALAPRLLL